MSNRGWLTRQRRVAGSRVVRFHLEGQEPLRKQSELGGSNPSTSTMEEPDNRPGHYYVSCMDGARRALIRGPWYNHREALDAVQRVKDEAYAVDHRSDLGPGVLGRAYDSM